MPRLVASVVLLVGCAQRQALDKVPIEGGTAQQRAAVIAELDRFEEWTGSGRIELTGIELREGFRAKKGHTGFYNRVTAKILLSGELSAEDIPMTLRHELCHALDGQEDLLAQKQPVFDTLAEEIRSDSKHPLHEALGSGARTHRAEVFAYVCQQAPLGTAMLSRPCAQGSNEYRDVAMWIEANAWRGTPDVDGNPSPLGASEPIGPWMLPFEVEEVQAAGSESFDGVRLTARGDGGSDWTSISSTDGSEIPLFEDLTIQAITDGYEAGGPYRAPDIGTFNVTSTDPMEAVSDGKNTLRVVRGLRQDSLGVHSAPQILVGAMTEPWAVVEGACPGREGSVFIANSQLFFAWSDGPSVWWASLSANP